MYAKIAPSQDALRELRGIQSVEVGHSILVALAERAAPMALRELAEATGIISTQVHAYLASYRRAGLVEQDGESGCYRLGWFALVLGLARIRYDPDLCSGLARMHHLVEATGAMGTFSIWCNKALTVFETLQGRSYLRINIRPGTTFPILRTLSGNVFAAYDRHLSVQEAIRSELAEKTASERRRVAAEFSRDLNLIRSQGYASDTSIGVPGLATLAIPHFGKDGAIAAVITLVSPDREHLRPKLIEASLDTSSTIEPWYFDPEDSGCIDLNVDQNARGVQSVEVGARLLKTLARTGGPVLLKELAERAQLRGPQAHPYLVSYRRTGLVASESGGRYGVGRGALDLAAGRMRSFNPHQAAADIVAAMARDLECAATISVWGNLGPTVVQAHEWGVQMYTLTGPGTVYAIAGTATGRLFAALLPERFVAPVIMSEMAEGEHSSRVGRHAVLTEIRKELVEIRQQGFATIEPPPIPGVVPFAASVCDHNGKVQMVVTLLVSTEKITVSSKPDHVAALLACTRRISRHFGATAQD